jgi:electron transport complex protein RnfA
LAVGLVIQRRLHRPHCDLQAVGAQLQLGKFAGGLGLQFLQTLAFILVIASLVQLVEMFLKKSIPSLYAALGIYLPLITTNCAVLGVVLLNVQNNYNFIESLIYGITGGLGFMLAIVLFASVRERVEFAEYPEHFEGFSICLVSAALVALAFMGFSGMSIPI